MQKRLRMLNVIECLIKYMLIAELANIEENKSEHSGTSFDDEGEISNNAASKLNYGGAIS
jgi:hypothetical protein